MKRLNVNVYIFWAIKSKLIPILLISNKFVEPCSRGRLKRSVSVCADDVDEPDPMRMPFGRGRIEKDRQMFKNSTKFKFERIHSWMKFDEDFKSPAKNLNRPDLTDKKSFRFVGQKKFPGLNSRIPFPL